MGWAIGKRAYDHRCPDCLKDAAEEAAKSKTQAGTAEVVSLKPTPPVAPAEVTEPMAVMDRPTRRLIHAKLEEVYADEVTGYRPGWSDQRTAKDLGVPLAWVQTVRDGAFGPHGANPEIVALRADMEQWIKEVHLLSARFDEIDSQFEALLEAGKKYEERLRVLSCADDA
jgi:hypothetical protein